MQCWTNVEDVGPALYKCYTNVLCLLVYHHEHDESKIDPSLRGGGGGGGWVRELHCVNSMVPAITMSYPPQKYITCSNLSEIARVSIKMSQSPLIPPPPQHHENVVTPIITEKSSSSSLADLWESWTHIIFQSNRFNIRECMVLTIKGCVVSRC